MKLCKILLITSLAVFVVSSTAIARDFSWTKDFNIQAKANPPKFRDTIADRFDLSDFQAMALRNIFASPADAYIMLRFGEIKGVLKKLTKEEGKEAIKTYRKNKSKGWDTLAEMLGVDTECKEYIALKINHDLHGMADTNQVAYNNYKSRNVN